MSGHTRTSRFVRLWVIAGLVFAGASLTGCVQSENMKGPPSFDALLQAFATEVDEGNDGSIEDSDAGSLTAGLGDPGILSTSSATQQVSFSAESDQDSILSNCEHLLTPGTSRTDCTGTVRGRFVPDGTGIGRFYVAATRSPGPLDTPPGLTDVLAGLVTIDCGIDADSEAVDNPSNGFPQSTRKKIALDVEEDTPCLVTIEHQATVTTSGLAVATSLIQTVSVTAAGVLSPDCTRSDQCPAEKPYCDANGACGTGDEGQPARVASVHCRSPYVSTYGCSWGVSGSPCRGPFECEDGHACSSGVCVGPTACTTDGDCPPEAAFCSDQGTCSPHGQQGDGCVTSQFCNQGLLCLSNRCTVRLGEGDVCGQPFTLCGGGTVCFEQSTGTCEEPLSLGASCAADDECADFPVANSCNQAIGAGVCSERQSSGGPCTKNLDCQGFTGCDIGTSTCN